jgi:hypothetical protein
MNGEDRPTDITAIVIIITIINSPLKKGFIDGNGTFKAFRNK